MRRLLRPLLVGLALLTSRVGLGAAPVAMTQVVVIPVRSEIADPQLYIIRRGLKEAIESHADLVVLDIKTPGGALETTFEIMEAMEKFPGHTVAYVDDEAMSAGAFVSAVTQEIWFAPTGVIGAAAPVDSSGKDVDSTMKAKLVSYLKARMRAVSEGKGNRGDVISAMIDEDQELKIGDKVIKAKGSLLSLTAKEAMATYGTPPTPLLGAGIAKSLTDLLDQKYGAGHYQVQTLEVTWSERLAVLLNRLAPVLMGIGMFALFLEFKTPGFGFFGIAGAFLLGVVFFGGYIAGLSGHEPIILFAVGLLLVFMELLFFHSAGFLGVAGVLAIILSLIWATADVWPNAPTGVTWSGDTFLHPALNLGLGVVIAIALGLALARFIPKGWFWSQFVVHSPSKGSAQVAGNSASVGLGTPVGLEGVVASDLRPTGQILVDGRRLEARLEVGTAVLGDKVRIVGSSDFALVVERIEA